MDQIIERLLTDPLFVKIGIVLAVLISLSLLKKLVKVVITLVLIFLIYGYYVYSTGAEPVKLDDVKEKIEELKEVDGRKVKKTLDKTMKEVKKKIEKGEDPKVEIKEIQRANRNFYSVQDLCDEYIERYARVRKKSWKEDERCLNKEVVSVWGKRKVKDITRRDIVELLDRIVDRGSPVTANRTLAVVRTAFNFAIKRAILDKSPCLLIEKPSVEKPRKRVLNEDEIKVFWRCLEKANMTNEIKLILKLLLITGQRRGEIVNAEWSEIDLDKGWWTIPGEKSKNGRPHRVPLSIQALKVFEEVQVLSGDSAYLFPASSGDSPITERAVSRAVRNNEDFFNIPHFTPHDLRRTVASKMTEIKIPQFIVSEILNHVEGGITGKTYDHYAYDEEKKQALAKWGKKIEEICGGLITVLSGNAYGEEKIAFYRDLSEKYPETNND